MKYEFETVVEKAVIVGRWHHWTDSLGLDQQDYRFDQIEIAGGHEHEDGDANFQVTVPRDKLSPQIDQRVKITVELLDGQKRTV